MGTCKYRKLMPPLSFVVNSQVCLVKIRYFAVFGSGWAQPYSILLDRTVFYDTKF